MKRKILLALLALAATLCLVFALPACTPAEETNTPGDTTQEEQQNDNEDDTEEKPNDSQDNADQDPEQGDEQDPEQDEGQPKPTEGLEYTISDDGTYYTVTGIGTTCNTDIVIPSEYNGLPVTTVGETAFLECTSITSVTITDGITTIGRGAFGYCTSLLSVNIPDSVNSIGMAPFLYCTSLEAINISKNNNVYHSDRNCIIQTETKTLIAGSKDSVIPDYVTNIAYGAFCGCTALTDIIIPDNVITIGDYAFTDCTALTEIVITGDVTSIGEHSFHGCSALTSIIIPNNVTSIGDYAFYNCASLASITIPDSVTSIGSNAFYGCISLTSVHITNISAWCNIEFYSYDSNPLYYAPNLYLNGELVTDLVIPDSVTSIGNFAFFGYFLLTDITIPESITSIGYSAFYGCFSLKSVHITNISAWCKIEFSEEESNPLINAHNLYLNGKLVTDLVIPNDVNSIGAHAFTGCTPLTSITIPENIISIGDSAFYGCYKLVEVYNLSNLNITKGSTENGFVGNYALDIHTSLNEESNLEILEEHYIFYNNNSEKYLISYIGTEDNLTLPQDYDGQNYSIYEYAFYCCTSIKNITIPDTVTSIRGYTFYGCSSLASISIGNSVTTIDDAAFINCTSLICVIIPNSVNSIGRGAFFGCDSLTSIIIPKNVTTIGNQAFEGCSSLETVYYTGTEDQWNEIDFGWSNDYLTDAEIIFNYEG